jgi:Fe-S-cluster containining protein
MVFGRALAELLVDKGLVEKKELESMMAQVGQQLEALPTPKVQLARSEDKYSFDGAVTIDCASRVHLCQAKCCTFAFYLTEQDLDEGIVRWDYGRPYWIQTGENGYCAHCEPRTWRCRIHAQRPYVCRAYDCRNDKRIWLDFEGMVPNPEPRAGGT